MSNCNDASHLNLNGAEAKTYLNTVFRHWTPETMGEIEFRDLSPQPEMRHKFSSTFEDCIKHAETQCNKMINVHIGVNPRVGKAGKKENVKYLTSFHVDLDYGTDGHKMSNTHSTRDEAFQAIQNFQLKPTLTVHSGGGFHLYWVLQEPLSVADYGIDPFEFINHELCRLLGGDVSNKDISRVLRLAGTYNLKDPDNPRPVTIVEQSNREYTYDEIKTFLDTQPPDDNVVHPRPKPVLKTPGGSAKQPLPITANLTEEDINALPISDKTKQLILNGKNEKIENEYPSRSEADIACVAGLLNAGVPDSVIYSIFQSFQIGDKFRSENDGFGYLSRTIQKAKEYQEEEQKNPHSKAGITIDDNGKAHLNPFQFQRHIFTKHNIVTLPTSSEFYKYDSGVYQKIGNKQLNQLCHKELSQHGKLLTQSTFKELIHHAEGYSSGIRAEDQFRYLTFQNVVYDMELDTFHQHSPEIFSTRSVNYAYDPNAKCPRFTQFLIEIFENDAERIEYLQLAMGYMFYPRISDPKLFFFVGNGANGKSVLLDVLRHLVGVDNTSCVNLNNLKDDKYLMQLKGKLLNAVDELSNQTIYETNPIKSMSSGGANYGKRLYQDIEKIEPRCKYIFATNRMPKFKDPSDGMIRRLAIIPFSRRFTVHEMDTTLLDNLLLELPGIFNFAHTGLQRLRELDYKFPEPDFITLQVQALMKRPNTVLAFADEDLVYEGMDVGILLSTAYQMYEQYCKGVGEKPINKNKFRNILCENGFSTFNSTKHQNQVFIIKDLVGCE